MKKIDPTVMQETKYVFYFSFLMSLVMQSVFLIIQKWDYTVVLGNVLGLFATTLNFFLMGISVQKALEKDPEDAKKSIKFSQSYRLLMLALVAILGAVVDIFNVWAVVLPMLFTRISVLLRQFTIRKK